MAVIPSPHKLSFIHISLLLELIFLIWPSTKSFLSCTNLNSCLRMPPILLLVLNAGRLASPVALGATRVVTSTPKEGTGKSLSTLLWSSVALGPLERTSLWFGKLLSPRFGPISLQSEGPTACERRDGGVGLAVGRVRLQGALQCHMIYCIPCVLVCLEIQKGKAQCFYSFPLYFMVQQTNTFLIYFLINLIRNLWGVWLEGRACLANSDLPPIY